MLHRPQQLPIRPGPNDRPTTLDFYRTLGLPIPQEANTEENVDSESEGAIVLGFLTEARAAQADPNFVAQTSSSLNLQFECGSPAEVNATFARLVAAGYAAYTQPWDTFWGQRFARITDPDNCIVDLYAPLEPGQD